MAILQPITDRVCEGSGETQTPSDKRSEAEASKVNMRLEILKTMLLATVILLSPLVAFFLGDSLASGRYWDAALQAFALTITAVYWLLWRALTHDVGTIID